MATNKTSGTKGKSRSIMNVRERSNGLLEYRVTIDGERHSIYGSTMKELREKESTLRESIKAGTYSKNRQITLDKYFEEWSRLKSTTARGNTMLGIKSRYRNHISPVLGKCKIVEIERRNIKNLQQTLLKDQKASSVNVIIGLVCDILNGAVEDNIIAKNPAARIKAARDENTKAVNTFHRALTEDEQNLFIEEAKSEWLYEMLGLMLCTGIRVGEAAALLWSDLDYKNNVIHITKTITRTAEGKYIEGPPKSKTGIRDIPMTDVVKDVLRSQKIKQTTVFGNVVSISQRVFTGISGSIVYNAVANSAITRTLKRLEEKGYKIEHFSCHALRDSFATRYIENGGTPQTLKTIMGHSSLAMTMDLYAHVLPNTKQKEMDNISEVFKTVMR